MGLFDAIREKAAELVSGATEKVSELTGTDVADAQQNASDAAQDLGDTAQGYADTATDSVQNVTDAAADTPLGTYVDPRDGQ